MATAFITITDTGKRSTASSVSEETDIVNSGSAMTLGGVEIVVEDGAIINTGASFAKLSGSDTTMFAVGEVDHLGTKKPRWTIRGTLSDKNASDMAMVKKLRDLTRTKGYKTLGGTIPDWRDGVLNSSVVNVRIDSVAITHQSSSSIINYSIIAFETD